MKSTVNFVKIADSLGTKVTFGRYRMWKNIPFIGDTALVVDRVEQHGGYALISPRNFPRKITPEYVEEAIRHHAVSLGEFRELHKSCRFTPWDKKVGKYPAGYFAHKVGDDVKEGVNV